MRNELSKITKKVLEEELSYRINNVKNKIFEDNKMKKEMCSECGGYMKEGECSECGYMKEEECMECGGYMKEGECSECGSSYMNENKKLSKGQKFIAKQATPKNKIGANDFAKLRSKKSETKEGKKFPDLSGDGKVTRKDVLLGRGVKLNGKTKKKETKENEEHYDSKNQMYELNFDESTGERFLFSENDIVNIIENIVIEEKKKNKSTNNVTKDSQKTSKKNNDKYVDDVVKKMKDYLKGGSKGEYEMNPKHFPKGNGDLAKMSKNAYKPSEMTQEYVENFTAAALENIDYDDIHPNEEWVEMNMVGHSRTGNNPEWANAVETEVNEKRNKIRKNNYLRRVQKMSYQKDDQPVKTDKTGEDGGDDEYKIFKMLNSSEKTKKPKKVNEEIKGETKILNEIEQMRDLITYNRKTQ
jgi:hypothetical protein